MGWHVGCSISKIKMSHVVMTAGAELCRLYPAQTCIYGPKESPKMVAQSARIGSIRSDVPLNPLNINTPWFVGYKKHDHDIAMVLLSPSFHIFPAINNSCELPLLHRSRCIFQLQRSQRCHIAKVELKVLARSRNLLPSRVTRSEIFSRI